MAAEASACAPAAGMPRWARRLELAAVALSVLAVSAVIRQVQVEYHGPPVKDEWSADVRAAEAGLLQWGMAHLRNCTPGPGVRDGIPAPAAGGVEPECHVVYSADAKMFSGLFTSMLSVARNLENPHACSIHLIVSDADYDQAVEVVACLARELEALRSSAPAVRLHRLRPLPVNVSAFDRVVPDRAYHRSVPQLYARWYLHEYLPQASRAIWLDADTVVRTDVLRLFREGAPRRGVLAAARLGRRLFWARRLEDLSRAPHVEAAYEEADADTWFDPGVLVVDLDRWRARSFSRSLESWLELTGGYLGIEMAMNLELRGDVEFLDWPWNLHSLGSARYPEACLDGALILHAGASDYDVFDPWECSSLAHGLAQPYEPARLRCRVLRRPRRAPALTSSAH